MPNPTTPAGRLVTAFGNPDHMAAMYADDVTWNLPAGLAQPALVGKEQVRAFNEAVWSLSYRPDCEVDLLDEIGTDGVSAVRFRYRGHLLVTDQPYENEYTVFVHADSDGIHAVFEAMDTVALLEALQGASPGTSFEAFISGAS
jgi:ketosteroid isomerase-like protein